jgi:uncharacterized caspase-like protein
VADVLTQKLCFDEVVQLRDADLEAMRDALYRLSRSIGEDDIVLVYYAGHGANIGGRDNLLPVDIDPGDSNPSLLSVADLANYLTGSSAALALVLLDTNFVVSHPFSTTRGIVTQRGLARYKPVSHIIVHATQPGEPAYDGIGLNSPFALGFERAMNRDDLSLLEQLNQIAWAVHDATQGRQVPYFNSHLAPTNFRLHGNCKES